MGRGSRTTSGRSPASRTGCFVWNVGAGSTRTVSGKHTRGWSDSSSTGAGVFELAIAGSCVAWIVNVGGNLEGDDYLFTSSTLKPKERCSPRRRATATPALGGRQSDCAGPWLGRLVGSGKLMVFNHWTTDFAPLRRCRRPLLRVDRKGHAVEHGRSRPQQPEPRRTDQDANARALRCPDGSAAEDSVRARQVAGEPRRPYRSTDSRRGVRRPWCRQRVP